jgi:hypothetical protein
MEEDDLALCPPEVVCWEHLDHGQSAAVVDSLASETLVRELKKQSSAGCVLCWLENSLEEDWDDA